jgi:alanine racemase
MEIYGNIDKEACSTWLEIDLGALIRNLKLMENITSTPIMPIVKANAYGHGLIDISRALEKAHVPWLGVARIEEGLALREAGIRTDILVLGYTPMRRIRDAIQQKITVTVYDESVAASYSEQALAAGSKVDVHVKVDTGMGRLGIFLDQAYGFMQWLQSQGGLNITGIFTHFARADEPIYSTTDEQIHKFDLLLQKLENNELKPVIVHAANSSGALNYPAGRYGLTRCGISLFGISPSPTTPLPQGFEPILSWKTHLTSLKVLPPGHGVSYNFQYFTEKQERIGVIAIGYADGFRRRKGNFALTHGKRVPVVGAVCMDQCMLQLDAVPEAKIGDEVVLIGVQGNECITVNDLARDWGTIPYEVICGLADRVPRFFSK